ncbi:hypothetical protein [Halalkalicoccus ordinarius]|uniref:hypothetical protein n=1 Tax=Halalkalicoccus ordinarius TaxID=3116651 RepID=UPI00300F4899
MGYLTPEDVPTDEPFDVLLTFDSKDGDDPEDAGTNDTEDVNDGDGNDDGC